MRFPVLLVLTHVCVLLNQASAFADYALHMLVVADTPYGWGWDSDYLGARNNSVSYRNEYGFEDDFVGPGEYRSGLSYARVSLRADSILGVRTEATKTWGVPTYIGYMPSIATATAYWQDVFFWSGRGPLKFDFVLTGKAAVAAKPHGHADSRIAMGISSEYMATPQLDVGNYGITNNSHFIINNGGWGNTDYFDEFQFDGYEFIGKKSVIIPYDSTVGGHRLAAFLTSRSTGTSGSSFIDVSNSIGLASVSDEHGNLIGKEHWRFASGMSSGVSSVPEPNVSLLLLLGSVSVWLRRRLSKLFCWT